METQDLILAIGEKVQELQTAGHHVFFSYSGHVDCYNVYCYAGKWSSGKIRAFDFNSHKFESLGSFLQAFQNRANLLILNGE